MPVGAPGSVPTDSSVQPSLDVTIRSAVGTVVATSTPLTTAMPKSIHRSPDRVPETMPRDFRATRSLRPLPLSLCHIALGCPMSLLQKCQLRCQVSVCTSIRPENALLRHPEARFLSFRGLPTADSVDLASRRSFATGSYGGRLKLRNCPKCAHRGAEAKNSQREAAVDLQGDASLRVDAVLAFDHEQSEVRAGRRLDDARPHARQLGSLPRVPCTKRVGLAGCGSTD